MKILRKRFSFDASHPYCLLAVPLTRPHVFKHTPVWLGLCAALSVPTIRAAENVDVNDTNVISLLQTDLRNPANRKAIGPSGLNNPDGASSTSDNTITVDHSGTSISGEIIGAWRSQKTDNTPLFNNTVKLKRGTVNTVAGARSMGSGELSNNHTEVSGGYVINWVFGAASENPGNTVVNNTIALSGGSVGVAYGGYATFGDAINNIVTITEGATVRGSIFGGSSTGGNANIASGNVIDMSGGNVGGKISGAYAGGNSNAIGNRVKISGGHVAGDVIGGENIAGNARSNSVTISGGKFGGSIYGGTVSSGVGDAIGNTVTISGNPEFHANTVLYGANLRSSGDFRTGNTLELKTTGLKVKGVENFANYNFYIPPTMTVGQTMLTVTDTVDLTRSKVRVGIDGSTSALKIGEQITLLDTGGLTSTLNNTRAEALQGIATIYDFLLTTDSNKLMASVLGNTGSGDGGSSGGSTGGGTGGGSSNGGNTEGGTGGGSSNGGSTEGGTGGGSSNGGSTEGGTGGGSSNGGSTEGGTGGGSSNGGNTGDGGTGGGIAGGAGGGGSAGTGANITVTNDSLNTSTQTDPNTPNKVSVGPPGLSQGSSSGNTIVVDYTGNKITGDLLGGHRTDGTSVSDNLVTLKDGTIGGNVTGGISKDGNANHNGATISGGTVINDVNGGIAQGTGNTTNNEVTISDGFVGNNVSGGTSKEGSANNNKVTVSGASTTVASDVNGGVAQNTGHSTGNTVTISNGLVDKNVAGGSSNTGNASDNKVSISEGLVVGSISGGTSKDGSVSNNTVTVSGGSVAGEVNGGTAQNAGNTTGNTVSISGGTISKDVLGGSSNTGNANENKVALSEGKVGGSISGGTSKDGSVSNNTVTVSGGSVAGGVNGGTAQNAGNTTGNAVSISGGTISKDVLGGSSYAGGSTGNTITISGGNLDGNIIGGAIHTGAGSATGNTITISGTPVFGANTFIYGGGTTNDGSDPNVSRPSGDLRTGNSLNLKSSGHKVKGIANFASYNFYLPTTMTAGQTMMTVADSVNLTGSTIRVGINGSTSALKVGEQVTLLDTGGLTSNLNNTRAEALQNIATLYDFQLTTDAKRLMASVIGYARGALAGRLNPQVKALLEGQVTGLANLGQSHDLLLGGGLDSLLNNVQHNNDSKTVSYAAVGGGDSRYNTGSHSDVSSRSLVIGTAWKLPVVGKAMPLLGGFFETGQGSYNTWNSFSNAASIEGEGSTHYKGFGVLLRIDVTNGFALDTSFKGGRSRTDFQADSLANLITGQRAHYDQGNTYLGAHVGATYHRQMAERFSLDVGSRVFWTRQSRAEVHVAGDNFTFDSATSLRVKNGVRVTYSAKERLKLYAGLAYDHEFGGKAGGSVAGRRIEAPSVKGDTIVGELGFAVQPSASRPLNINLGVQGYTGMRQGYSSNLRMTYSF